MSTPPVTSSSSAAAVYGDAFGADDLLPVRPRGYNPDQGLPREDTSVERLSQSAEKTLLVLPPRPQNESIATPFNPATSFFESSTVKAGDISVTTRYNNGGLLTQPSDRGAQPLSPAGLTANPVRLDLTVPVIGDATFRLDLKGRLDTNQNLRVGPEIGLALGNLKVTAGIFENQPVQSVFQDDGRARTEVNGTASLTLQQGLSLGVGVVRTSGGSAGQSATTRFDTSVTATVEGTQVQVGATFTQDDGRGNVQVGGLLTVQPEKPDNTRPYGFAVIKYGDNPLTDASTSFSVNGGIRF